MSSHRQACEGGIKVNRVSEIWGPVLTSVLCDLGQIREPLWASTESTLNDHFFLFYSRGYQFPDGFYYCKYFYQCVCLIVLAVGSFLHQEPIFFFFLWLHLWHTEVPRLEVTGMGATAMTYTTATATVDLNCISDRSSRQYRILNPLSGGHGWNSHPHGY